MCLPCFTRSISIAAGPSADTRLQPPGHSTMSSKISCSLRSSQTFSTRLGPTRLPASGAEQLPRSFPLQVICSYHWVAQPLLYKQIQSISFQNIYAFTGSVLLKDPAYPRIKTFNKGSHRRTEQGLQYENLGSATDTRNSVENDTGIWRTGTFTLGSTNISNCITQLWGAVLLAIPDLNISQFMKT